MKPLFVLAVGVAAVLGTGGPVGAVQRKNKAAAAEAAADAMFVKLDANKDAKLTKAEFRKLPTVLPAAQGNKPGEKGRKPGEKGQKPGAKAPAAGGVDLDGLWNKLVKVDSNTLTKEDFRAVTALLPQARAKKK